jgi:hypothetical protein
VPVGFQREDLDSGILADDAFLCECDEVAYDLCGIILRCGHEVNLMMVDGECWYSLRCAGCLLKDRGTHLYLKFCTASCRP